MTEDELFNCLVTGNIPAELPAVPPEICKRVLIDAVRALETMELEAEDSRESTEYFTEWIRSCARAGDRPEEDAAVLRLLLQEIESCEERAAGARDLMKSCESRLLDLLEEHPELKDSGA